MGRRSNGEGSIYQRSDGRWCASVRLAGTRRVLYGRTRQEVACRLSELLQTARRGAIVAPQLASAMLWWPAAARDLLPANPSGYCSLRHGPSGPGRGPMPKQSEDTNAGERLRRRGLMAGVAALVAGFLAKAVEVPPPPPPLPAHLREVPRVSPALHLRRPRRVPAIPVAARRVPVCSHWRVPDADKRLANSTGYPSPPATVLCTVMVVMG
jgi:hypothetical protein